MYGEKEREKVCILNFFVILPLFLIVIVIVFDGSLHFLSQIRRQVATFVLCTVLFIFFNFFTKGE